MTVGLPVAVLAAAAAQTKEAVRTTSAKKRRVLHMANPRRDTFNLRVADVLAPR
jgi:hypothetical protein